MYLKTDQCNNFVTLNSLKITNESEKRQTFVLEYLKTDQCNKIVALKITNLCSDGEKNTISIRS